MYTSHVSVIIPVYNPHPGWDHELNYSISQLVHYFGDQKFALVIVNDGSSTPLEYEINKLSKTYPFVIYNAYKENRGKGHAIREGMKMVSSDYYIYTDWDFPFGQKIVYETFLMLENGGCQLVIGKRNKTYFKSLPFLRKVISRSLQMANYITTGFKVVDTQAGLKGLNRRVSEILLATETNGFIFELEFIRACLKRNISFSFIDASIGSKTKFANFSWNTVYRELKTYLKLFLARK